MGIPPPSRELGFYLISYHPAMRLKALSSQLILNLADGKDSCLMKWPAAIVDRLVHHSHMLIFTGKSYRMTNSLMK